MVEYLDPLISASSISAGSCFHRLLPACVDLEPWWFGERSGEAHAQVVIGGLHSIHSGISV
jgi:hypothetical protein